MRNNLILEEIQRFRLLSGYKSSKTLTENEQEIEEQGVLGSMKGITFAAKDIEAVVKDLETAFKAGKDGVGGAAKVFRDFKLTNIQGGSKELINLLTKDLASLEKDLVKAVQQDMKNGLAPLKDTRSLSKDISKVIAIRRIMDEQAALTEVALAQGKRAPKLSKTRVEQIANEVKAATTERAASVTPKAPKTGGGGGKGGGGGVKATENSTSFVINIDNTIENQVQQIIKRLEQTEGRGAWKWTSGKWTWGNVWPLLAAAGTGAAIYGLLSWLFSKNGVQYFPQCIGGKVMLNPQGLEKTAKEGLPTNMVYMMDPANPKLNGALFISDGKNSKTGKVKLPDGKSGSYIHTGDQVEIKAGGDVINMDCSQTLVIQGGGNQETTPKPKPSGGCTPSSNFPFEYYQRNSMVGQVQNCVGASVDNCMGPQTAGKIQQFLGLSETPPSLTKDIYDKVMAKCKGSTSTKQEPIKEPTQTSGGVTGGGEKPSSEEDFEY